VPSRTSGSGARPGETGWPQGQHRAPGRPHEIETAFLELKSTILGGRVLRARTPAGIAQEVYALLACYQILRIAITDAIEAAGGTDPDRASFTIALNAARDLLIQAAGVIAGTVIDLTGGIGRRVLGSLLPARRLRVSPRIVKRALSGTRPKDQISPDAATKPPSISILATPDP
jgi:hypothetical protein